MLLRTGWIDTGVIWAYTADWLHNPSTTSTSKRAENNVHVWRPGYGKHVRFTCTTYMYAVHVS